MNNVTRKPDEGSMIVDGVPRVPMSAILQSDNLSFPRRFSVQVAGTLAVRLLMTLNSLIAGVIVARWLGAEGLGTLAVINVTVGTAVQAGSTLPSANTYFISRDSRRLAPAAINSLVYALVAGGLLAVAVIGLARWRPEIFGYIPLGLIVVAALSIPFQLVTVTALNIFLAVGQIARLNLLDLGGQVFVLVNAVLTLILLKRGLWMLVALNTAASVAVALTVTFLIARLIASQSDTEKGRIHTGLFAEMVRYGIKTHISILAGALIFRADLLVVNHFRGSADAGVYSVASQVAMLLMLLPGVIATLLFPRVTAARDLHGEMTCLVTRHTTLVMSFVCLVAVPMSFVLPLLYGSRFSDVAVQLLILLPGVFLIALESVLVQHFNATGLPPQIPLLWLATLAINVLLVFTMVPRFGARGAATASTLSYALIFVLVAVYFRARTKRSVADAFLPRGDELRALLATLRGAVSSR
jgi:O-antigen/teichoic acid export membrane protein